jgi:hypothetical protein
MKQQGLKIGIITYNTLLRKAQRAPFGETLALLEAMQAAQLNPQTKFDRRTKKQYHYTLKAIFPSVKKNRKIFTEWAKQKGSQERAWIDFYARIIERLS